MHSEGEMLIERFERYWLGLGTAMLRSRAKKYLSVGFMKDEDGRMAPGLAKSPERRRQPMRAARTFGGILAAPQELDRSGLDSDVDEWSPDGNMELTSSSSDGHSSEQNEMEY